MSGHRLATGGLIDRTRRLQFTFDGQSLGGFQGDTLASALLANGVQIVGRSFKYHRPRGLWGAWFDDPNGIMDVTLAGQTFPNCPATTTQLCDGMTARSVNAWPTAAFDVKAGFDLFHRWLGAGFYYKTFIWPDWHLFEPTIRRMAGLGTVSLDAPDGFVSDQMHDRCDTLIVGGGAAGLAAARAACEAGRDVVLIDDHPECGGGVFRTGPLEGRQPADWVGAQNAAIGAAGGRILTGTTAFGIYDHGLVALAEDRGFGRAPRLIKMRPSRTILATGAMDRPITFADNDRPGIMSLDAASEYQARYGVLAGRDIAVLANHSHAARSIAVLEEAGARINALDLSLGHPRAVGRRQIRGVELAGIRHQADCILTSGGLIPTVHLWRHAGGKLSWDEPRQVFLPSAGPDNLLVIGGANGTFDIEGALDEARAVGADRPVPRHETTYSLTPLWPSPESKGRQWIDFQHDVTLKDVEVAARENYVSVEHLKRYTTLGMATDQGKTSNMSGLAAMAAIRQRPIPEVGTTTFRPPFVPIPMELYRGPHGGTHLNPPQRLDLEDLHRAADAALGEYGGWLRPAWYGNDDARAHIQAEARTAREQAGIFDASPLGKIEVMGPNAEAFVNFIYYNTVATLKPGAIRYGFMLNEQGIVYDDGVIARLDTNRFLISCSSSHVAGVHAHLENWRQDGNDPDRIFIHDMTHAWSTVTITGPRAREIVATLKLDIDLAGPAFPHMTLRETEFEGFAMRIARVSFTGDLSYELSVRPSIAPRLWNLLCAAGAAVGACPLGLEALAILRAEKGFIMIGKDTDGETMPHDLGFDVPRKRKTAQFVGDRSLHTPVANAPDRPHLVGLRVPEGAPPIATGAHVIDNASPAHSVGIVTSSYASPNLAHPIALALLRAGMDRYGEEVDVWHMGQTAKATVCDPCFFDPKGERLHA